MPVTTNMVMTLPTEDGSSGTWDTLLNTALGLIDSHDHSSGKGVTVKSAGISINADLPWGGFAATGLKAVDFNAIAAATMSGYACALFANSADNELYWRTAAGANVQLTSGTSLNSALLGGFTGDYGAGAEEAEYTSGTGIYDFRQAATTRGFLDCSDIRLFEATAGITNAVKLKSPASLAAAYTMTLPAALPGSTQLLQLSSGGVITASNTVANATTFSALITATLGLTAAVDQHVTVSGTGVFKHGERTMPIAVGGGYSENGAMTDFGCWEASNANNTYREPIRGLPHGARIKSVTFIHLSGGAGDKTLQVERLGTTSTSSISAPSAMTTTFNPAESVRVETTITPATPYTTVAEDILYFTYYGSAVGDQFWGGWVTYDQP